VHIMGDLIFVALALVFFVGTAGFVIALDRL
jgi:hypothetical protein